MKSRWFAHACLKNFLLLCLVVVAGAALCAGQTGAWLTHSHDEQHSGVSDVASQPLNRILWHTPADLAPPQGEIR